MLVVTALATHGCILGGKKRTGGGTNVGSGSGSDEGGDGGGRPTVTAPR